MRLTGHPGGRSMAVPTTLKFRRPCMPCTPHRISGPGGGGGGAGLSPCRGLGEEGEGGGGRAPPAGGGGCGGLSRAPRLVAGRGGGGGAGPLLRCTSAPAEAAAGAAPLRPALAPLPIEGLWGRCETAAPGRGSVSSSAVHHCTPCTGGGGGTGGRYGGGTGRFGGSHTRRCTQRAVHTQGGAHKRRPVATAGVLLYEGATGKAVHTERDTHTRWCAQKAACSHRRSLVIEGVTGKAVHTEGSTHRGQCTHNTVHTTRGQRRSLVI